MRIRNAKELGAFVREHRLKLGLSQAQLAERVGVSRLWVILLEKGKSSSQVGLVLRTFDVLGITLEAGEKQAPASLGGIALDQLLKGKTGKARA